VPTLAGLCDGGLACMRTAGLPRLASFEELATGVYARPSRELRRDPGDADEFGAITMFLETWPNAIGAAQRWPREQGGRMENAMIGQAVEAVGRIEGMGGSLRSLHANRPQRQPATSSATAPAGQDLNLMRTLLASPASASTPITLPQVAGKVESGRDPRRRRPRDPAARHRPRHRPRRRPRHRGRLGRGRRQQRPPRLDAGPRAQRRRQPAFYFELPDLWQLIAATGDAPRELNFAQSWLSGRSLRVAGDLIDGRLRIDMQLARAATAAPPAIAR
jgi:hypothetical protein